jgi:hypothetical protein
MDIFSIKDRYKASFPQECAYRDAMQIVLDAMTHCGGDPLQQLSRVHNYLYGEYLKSPIVATPLASWDSRTENGVAYPDEPIWNQEFRGQSVDGSYGTTWINMGKVAQ